MRLGYFGGSFDPPHCGHLAIAHAAAERFALDRVLLVPTGVQPLKPGGPVAPYTDRMEMTRLLCEGEAAFEAAALEGPRADGAPNFTVDTLRALRRTLAADVELFVLVGVDAFLDLRRWREPDALLALAEWIVITRPGFAAGGFDALQLTAEQQARVHLLEGLAEPASSTEIRARLTRGESCAELLPERVERYIVGHGLYGAVRSA